MIRVGLVGIGFMGWIHWLAYRRAAGARVAAICTRDPRRLAGDWRGIQGNFGPPGDIVDLAGVATHADLDDMLADPGIDLVDVTLPTSLHADVAIRALEAGKHVLCEKPMALRPADCDRMVDAARRADRLLMVAHVLPFLAEYRWALETIRDGRHGAVRGGSFRRVISDPAWLQDFWNPDRIGGPLLDLHVHDAHFILLAFGKPDEVTSVGRLRGGVPEFWHSLFRFADRGIVVEATSGTIDQQGRSFTHGFEIHLERATLLFDFAVLGGEGRYLCEPTLLDDRGGAVKAALPAADPVDGFTAEIAEAVRCIEEGRPSDILGATLATDAMRLCAAQAESLRTGRPVRL